MSLAQIAIFGVNHCADDVPRLTEYANSSQFIPMRSPKAALRALRRARSTATGRRELQEP